MITQRGRRGSARPVLVTTPPVGYFTDDVDLYRVVRWLRRPTEPPLAEVENCRSLACELLGPEDLARLYVRVVSSAAVAEQ
jgi:hypothetical protein